MATIHATWKHVMKDAEYVTYSETTSTFLTRSSYELVETEMQKAMPTTWDCWRLIKLEYVK